MLTRKKKDTSLSARAKKEYIMVLSCDSFNGRTRTTIAKKKSGSGAKRDGARFSNSQKKEVEPRKKGTFNSLGGVK